MFGEDDVLGRRVGFASPGVAVTGHGTGSGVGPIELEDFVEEFRGAVGDGEIVVFRGEDGVRGIPNAEGLVQPGEVAVRSGATELAGKVCVVDGGSGAFGPVADFAFGADVR